MLRKSICVAAVAAALCGCSHAGSITRTSADYNKAMATVRNEQLLLNIMRAAAREPLQFSAMGEINTTFDRTGEVDTNLNNLIVGGVNSITQLVKLTGSNKPVVKISPLSNKEFITGMLRPTSPETIRQFMDLGWDAEFMMPLLIRGYRCPEDASFTWLRGTDRELQSTISRVSNAGSKAHWATAKAAGKQVELRVADDKALEMLRSGVSGGFRVDSIHDGTVPGTSIVKLAGPDTLTTTLQMPLCKSQDEGALTAFGFGEHDPSAKAPHHDGTHGQIAFRSVEGIIYFLGERLRHCYLERSQMQACTLTYGRAGADGAEPAKRKYLLHIQAGPKPAETAVGASYYGTNYWVSRLDRDDVDRTMKTFAFLNQLIALQTESSATGTTTTVLAIDGD